MHYSSVQFTSWDTKKSEGHMGKKDISETRNHTRTQIVVISCSKSTAVKQVALNEMLFPPLVPLRPVV